MRKILFKGKRKDNGEWVEGFYVHLPRGRYSKDEHLIQTIKENGNIGQLYEVIPETVGQFTGLTDNTKWEQLTKEEQSDWLKNHTAYEWNGKQIFEGDVIEIRNDNAPIKKSVAVVKFGEFTPKFFYTLYEWYYDRELKDKLHGLYLENVEGEQMFFCSTTTTIRVIGNIHDPRTFKEW